MGGTPTPKEHRDQRTGGSIRITNTHLVVLNNFRGSLGQSRHYPLEDIFRVRTRRLPGKKVAVFVALHDDQGSCGFTFADAELAEDFEMDLKAALKRRRDENCRNQRREQESNAGEKNRARRRPGSAAGRIIIHDDFDDPLPEEMLASLEGREPDEQSSPNNDSTDDDG